MKRIIILILSLGIVLISNYSFAKTDDEAIGYIKNHQISYAGVNATYIEVSTAFAVSHFNGIKFIGWETKPDPKNPVATLVSMKFSTVSEKVDLHIKNSNKKLKMKEAIPLLIITWRVNSLMGVKITPYNYYAKESLEVYKGMVETIHELSK